MKIDISKIDGIEIEPKRMGGVPTLAGRRFTVAQLLAELAEGRTLEDVADGYSLDINLCRKVLDGLADSLNASPHRKKDK